MMWQSPLPVQVRPNASEVAPPGGRTPFLPGLWWSAQSVPQPNATLLTPFPTAMERGTALESCAPTPRSGSPPAPPTYARLQPNLPTAELQEPRTAVPGPERAMLLVVPLLVAPPPAIARNSGFSANQLRAA